MINDFKFIMPANLTKSDNGDWVVAGLASTSSIDLQGESIDQTGMDLTPIDEGKGWFNWDHKAGVDNLLGTLDSYEKTSKGLFVKGRLFKNKEKSKSVYEIMSSLGKSDTGRIGMSVEGQILERDPKNPKLIKKCKISKVALTLNPVNTDTYATLSKSLNLEDDNLIKSIISSEVIFNSTEENVTTDESSETIFTASQVLALAKALSMSDGYTKAPNKLTDGDAMATSSLTSKVPSKKKNDDDDDETKVKKKKLVKMSKSLYKSNMLNVLDQLQILHPDCSRSQLWEALKDRLDVKYIDTTCTD